MLFPGLSSIGYGSPCNKLAPLNRELVGWWLVLPKRYGGLLLIDLAGVRHGVLTNMDTSSATSGWGATTRQGGYGEVRYDGSNDYVLVSSAKILSGLTDWSMCVCEKTTSSNVVGGKAMYCERASGGLDILKLDSVDTTSQNSAIITMRDDSATLLQVRGTATINDGAWHQIVGVKAGTAVTLYVDGKQDASGTWSGTNTFTNASDSRIGTDQLSALSAWNGSIDDVRLYTRALSASEVSGLFQASRQGYRREINRQTFFMLNTAGGLTYPQLERGIRGLNRGLTLGRR